MRVPDDFKSIFVGRVPVTPSCKLFHDSKKFGIPLRLIFCDDTSYASVYWKTDTGSSQSCRKLNRNQHLLERRKKTSIVRQNLSFQNRNFGLS